MAAVAIHIAFFWVLGLTMNAKVVDKIDDQPKVEQIQETEKNERK